MIQYFKNRDLFPGIVKSMLHQNVALGMKKDFILRANTVWHILINTTVIIAVYDNRWSSLCLLPISLAPGSLFVYSSMALDRLS